MKIRRKRINNIETILEIIGDNNFIITAKSTNKEKLKDIGFSTLSVDETIIPMIIGTNTRFNKRGKNIIDEPKEKEVISKQISYVRKKDGVKISYIRTYERWKRVFINAVNEKITILNVDSNYTICSRTLSTKEDTYIIKHIINMMLELFGEVEIVDDKLKPIMVHEKVPWTILPPGEMPWEQFYNHIESKIKNYTPEEKKTVKERYEFLVSLGNAKVITGALGFSGYFIVELDNGLHLCDSVYKDNAIYILDNDWEEISKLTKKELLCNKWVLKRIIHNEGWQSKVIVFINKYDKKKAD